MDSNAAVGWCRGQGEFVPHGLDGKSLRMLDKLRGRGLAVMGPTEGQRSLPTSRPRKQGVQGTVIDLVATSIPLKRSLAAKIAKPRQSEAYKDPVKVKQLSASSWKIALKQRQQARKEWEEQQLSQAVQGNWKALKASRRRISAWEPGFAEATEGEPHEAIHGHLKGIYQGPGTGPWNPEGREVQETAPFLLEDLQRAADKGKMGKSLGPDGVPHELIRELALHPEAGPLLLEWYNGILRPGEMPEDWSSVVMIVLPKVAAPRQASEVRPISMGSAACKVFSRMLLEKALPLLGEAGTRQCAGAGRQASDYIFSVARLMSLEREWRFGLSFFKLDLSKAFDRVSRAKLYSMIRTRIGTTQACRCWWGLLQSTPRGVARRLTCARG